MSSMPGWYPDPAGAPGRFRYWNGSTWSADTTANPAQTPAPGVPPLSPGEQPRKGGRGALAAILALLLMVVVVVTWKHFGGGGSSGSDAPVDTNTSTPTVSAWNETSSPTPTKDPSSADPEPSGADLVTCPDTGGDFHAPRPGELNGGGIVADTVPGWDTNNNFGMGWAHGLEAVTSNYNLTWFSVVSTSALYRSDGFTGIQQAARGVMSCMATSSYYGGYTGRHDVTAQQIQVSGHRAYYLRAEVYVSRDDDVKGDVVDVVVVDTGDPQTFGLFLSTVTIGDAGRQQLADASRASLRLAGS